MRAISLWNSLPQSVVDSEDVKSFEIALDKFWDDQVMKYDDFTKNINTIHNKRYAEYLT